MYFLRTISSLLFVSCLAHGGDIKQPTLSPDLALVCPLAQGQQAPFSGVLLSVKASAMVIGEYGLLDERVRIEVDNATKIAEIKMNFELKEQESKFITERTTLQAQITARDEKISLLDRDLKKSEEDVKRLIEDTPNRAIWAGIGFVSGIVFTIATAYAIGQVVN